MNRHGKTHIATAITDGDKFIKRLHHENLINNLQKLLDTHDVQSTSLLCNDVISAFVRVARELAFDQRIPVAVVEHNIEI